jgi:hypothetical protein
MVAVTVSVARTHWLRPVLRTSASGRRGQGRPARNSPTGSPPRRRSRRSSEDVRSRKKSPVAPDDVYEVMAREFDPAEQVALTMAIVAINGWNRFSVGFRRPVGSYVSGRHPEPGAGR